MYKFEVDRYSAAVRKILEPAEGGARLMPLAPNRRWDNPGYQQLETTAEEQLAPAGAAAPHALSSLRSALYLYFSDLDRSHGISQDIPTATGSFLHGIMHRQEPDYSNSKYWFRRVGDHPLYPRLREEAISWARESANAEAKRLGEAIAQRAEWDPFWFVDQCSRGVGRGDDLEQALMELQRLEWQLLFDSCYREASGA